MGALFAVLALVIASVSFPLMLDRQATLGAAIRTSVQPVRLNTGAMAPRGSGKKSRASHPPQAAWRIKPAAWDRKSFLPISSPFARRIS